MGDLLHGADVGEVFDATTEQPEYSCSNAPQWVVRSLRVGERIKVN